MNRLSLPLVLLGVSALAQMPPEPSSAPKLNYSTNMLASVKCPQCERTSTLHPFKVDRSFRMEPSGQSLARVNQYVCWYACPHPECKEVWSVTRERYVDLDMKVLAETNAPNLPPLPMATILKLDPPPPLAQFYTTNIYTTNIYPPINYYPITNLTAEHPNFSLSTDSWGWGFDMLSAKNMGFAELVQRWATNRENLWIIEAHK